MLRCWVYGFDGGRTKVEAACEHVKRGSVVNRGRDLVALRVDPARGCVFGRAQSLRASRWHESARRSATGGTCT